MITKDKLYRIETEDKHAAIQLGGVCRGLEEYLGIDVTIIRLFFIITFLFTPIPSGWVYLILWLILPEKPKIEQEQKTP